ncbi:hypothetical protein ACKKBG_A39405 [Auxenochlorella protothecoides x Auxenochlorella symbiontica]
MVLITSSCLVRAGVGAGNLHARTHRSGSICLTGLGTPSRARSGRPNQQAVHAGQGFGQTAGNPSPQKSNKKVSRLQQNLGQNDDEGTASSAQEATTQDWMEVPDLDVRSAFLSKPIKAASLPGGRVLMFYKVGETFFCSAANSTAFKYPLADASIIQVKGKPAVEVRLDGTVYDLASGKVLSWCPKNNLFRKAIGSLKDKQDPIDLEVYPVKLASRGRLLVKL